MSYGKSALIHHCMKQNWRCHYCGVEMWYFNSGIAGGRKRDVATIDHRIPRHAGFRRHHTSNPVAACYGCNAAKGPLTNAVFMMLRHEPKLLCKVRDAVSTQLSRDGARRHERRMTRAAQMSKIRLIDDTETAFAVAFAEYAEKKGIDVSDLTKGR